MADGVVLDPAYSRAYISTIGKNTQNPFIVKYLLLSFLGAVYIGIGTQGGMVVDGGVGKTFLGGITYSFGLAAIVYLGGDFFCMNPLLVSAVIAKRGVAPWKIIRDWFVNICMNIAGAIAIAAIVHGSGVNGQQNAVNEGFGPIICANARDYFAWTHSGRAFIGGIIGGALMQIAVLWAQTANTPVGKYASVALPSILFWVNKWHCLPQLLYILFVSTFLDCPKAFQKDLWENMALSGCGNLVAYLFLGFFYWVLYVHGTDEAAADKETEPTSA
jgi:formate/nitrite transporter FocA (FNT family)